MKTTLKLAILISGLLFMNGCGSQVDCPGFNEEILEWVPYQNNDTVRLMTSSTD